MLTASPTLKDLREARGLAQEDLGIQGHISRIEAGKTSPSPDTITAILKALNAADPSHPVSRVELVTAIRAGQAQKASRVGGTARSEQEKPCPGQS